MVDTPNHDYARPEEGTQDWHVPLNANFDALDADIEVRDAGAPDASGNDYDPREGAKYLDTSSGVVYIGNGNGWTAVFALPAGNENGITSLSGGLTDGETLDTLTGTNLSIQNGTLNATLEGEGIQSLTGGDGIAPSDIGNQDTLSVAWEDAGALDPSGSLPSDTVTVAGNSVSLGGSTGIDHGDLSNVSANQHHAKNHDHSESDIDAVPNAGLVNNSVTVAGNSVSLGGSTALPHNDLATITSNDHHTRPSAGTGTTDDSNTFNVNAGAYLSASSSDISFAGAAEWAGTGDDNSTPFGDDITIAGGDFNTGNGNYSTIGGGENNTTNDAHATVSGGLGNEAQAPRSTVGGGQTNKARNGDATVAGGNSNQAGDGTTDGGAYATVGGGQDNEAKANHATVSGGEGNQAFGAGATVGGGGADFFNGNTASGRNATIGGGAENVASSDEATVGGGRDNEANGSSSTIGGGQLNAATGNSATVGGGSGNTAGASSATVPGGVENTASAGASFAAGNAAKATNTSAFVWNNGFNYHSNPDGLDSSKAVNGESVTGPETFSVSATGGVRMITGSSSVTYIPSGSTGWSNASSRAVKTNIEPVEPEQALAGVEELGVATWEYEDRDGEGAGTTHIGPMAEEFHDAFDVGDSDEHINSVNADGIALAAIQGLSAKLDDREERIEALEAENEQLRERNAELERRLAAVEEQLGLDDSGASAQGVADN
jgi:hypothetical protein